MRQEVLHFSEYQEVTANRDLVARAFRWKRSLAMRRIPALENQGSRD